MNHFMHFEFLLGWPFFSPSSGRYPHPFNNPFDFSYHMQYTSNLVVGNGRSVDNKYGFIDTIAGAKSELLCTDCSSSQWKPG